MEIKPHIRYMIRRDMPEVLAIENASFEFAWSPEDFIRCLRNRNSIGLVAEFEECIAGFVIYELHKARLHILNIAVHPDVRHCGVATALVNNLVGKLSENRRTRIMLEIRESNIDAQLFFRSQGFLAVSVLRDFYADTTEDAYLFQYRFQAEPETSPLITNRITRSAGMQ